MMTKRMMVVGGGLLLLLLGLMLLAGQQGVVAKGGRLRQPYASPSPTAACGPAWNVISTTNVSTLTNQFLGVAAVDADHVWAVGDYLENHDPQQINRTLVQQWDGTQWQVVSSPNASSEQNTLYAVAAISTTEAWATGTYSDTGQYRTLTERWDGSAWQVVNSPNPNGSNTSVLYGVTTGGSNPMAVGGYKTIGDYLTLAVRWDGSAWQLALPQNVGSGDNLLLGMTATATDTWAVGYWNEILTPTRHTLIERWDGSNWQVVSSPNVGNGDNTLESVTALSNGDAWAVGFTNDNGTVNPLILHWDGSSWQIVSNPSFGVPTLLTSVAAVGASDIWAVGASLSSLDAATLAQLQAARPARLDNFATLIEHWDGNTWQAVGSPNVGNDDYLNGVAVVSGLDVWAVGYYQNAGGSGQTLALRYTGDCLASPTPGPTQTRTPTITPTAQATATDCPNPFTDVQGNIFYPAIHALYCRGVVNGIGPTTFGPGGTSTRAQFAKVVVLGFGIAAYTPSGNPDFTDVPSSYFAYLYIESGFHEGILSGFDAGTCGGAGATFPCYLPNRPITRAQITKLVVSAAGYTVITPTGGQPTFSDVPTSNVFFSFIETAAAKHVVNGYPDNTFRPNANIRRDQMCQIVYAGITTPSYLLHHCYFAKFIIAPLHQSFLTHYSSLLCVPTSISPNLAIEDRGGF